MGGCSAKQIGSIKDNLVNRAKMLDSSARALLGMAKAMLSARADGTDPLAAIERTIGWQGRTRRSTKLSHGLINSTVHQRSAVHHLRNQLDYLASCRAIRGKSQG